MTAQEAISRARDAVTHEEIVIAANEIAKECDLPTIEEALELIPISRTHHTLEVAYDYRDEIDRGQR